MPDIIITSRLVEYIHYEALDPWNVGFRIEMVQEVNGRNDHMFSSEDIHTNKVSWDAEDHARRIRSIMDTPAWYNDPISVDNECAGGTIYPIPILLDGWHRLIAHMVKKDEVLHVEYGGRVDLLRYLQGKRKVKPAY